jgi:hypothetical protein
MLFMSAKQMLLASPTTNSLDFIQTFLFFQSVGEQRRER